MFSVYVSVSLILYWPLLQWQVLKNLLLFSSGSMEFVVPPSDPSSFFPIDVKFSAAKTFCDIKVIFSLFQDMIGKGQVIFYLFQDKILKACNWYCNILAWYHHKATHGNQKYAISAINSIPELNISSALKKLNLSPDLLCENEGKRSPYLIWYNMNYVIALICNSTVFLFKLDILNTNALLK